MKRIASNRVLTRDDGVLENAVVELTDDLVVSSISLLEEMQVEPYATEFVDGWLTGDNGEGIYVGYKFKNK
ncbi:MAG: hypothetical protein MJZ93_04635 [Paludibacteraceae bacterium]|nr:hypothetical protein [Paludibacteraceae bacterium]